MAFPALDISGERFAKLVALRRIGSDGKRAIWLFQCDCGGSYKGAASFVKIGVVKSCGCGRRFFSSPSPNDALSYDNRPAGGWYGRKWDDDKPS